MPPIDGNGLVAHYELDGSFSDISGRYRTAARSPAIRRSTSDRSAARRRFDGDTEVSFGNVGAFERTEPFSIAVWLRGRGQPADGGVAEVCRRRDKRHGYEWRFDDIALVDIQRWAARLNIRLVGDTPADAMHDSHARAADARRLVPRRA